MDKEQKILSILFKDRKANHNSRTISKLIGISHPGAFKLMKRMEKEQLIIPERIGKAVIYKPNLKSPLVIKKIELALMQEAKLHKRWLYEFESIGKMSKFVILFGSILRNEKEAHDVDLLVIAEKENYKKIKEIVYEKNVILIKKVHLLFQRKEDFKLDLKNNHKVILDAIKTGVVLYGQEEFVKALIEE